MVSCLSLAQCDLEECFFKCTLYQADQLCEGIGESSVSNRPRSDHRALKMLKKYATRVDAVLWIVSLVLARCTLQSARFVESQFSDSYECIFDTECLLLYFCLYKGHLLHPHWSEKQLCKFSLYFAWQCKYSLHVQLHITHFCCIPADRFVFNLVLVVSHYG